MAASVCRNTCVSACAISVRASAEMMPLVTVWPTPNGLPMASTTSPTSSLSLSANCRNGKSLPPFSIFSTARSVRSSWATIGVELALVGQRHADLRIGAALDDVRVGDDDAVGG